MEKGKRGARDVVEEPAVPHGKRPQGWREKKLNDGKGKEWGGPHSMGGTTPKN